MYCYHDCHLPRLLSNPIRLCHFKGNVGCFENFIRYVMFFSCILLKGQSVCSMRLFGLCLSHTIFNVLFMIKLSPSTSLIYFLLFCVNWWKGMSCWRSQVIFCSTRFLICDSHISATMEVLMYIYLGHFKNDYNAFSRRHHQVHVWNDKIQCQKPILKFQ